MFGVANICIALSVLASVHTENVYVNMQQLAIVRSFNQTKETFTDSCETIKPSLQTIFDHYYKDLISKNEIIRPLDGERIFYQYWHEGLIPILNKLDTSQWKGEEHKQFLSLAWDVVFTKIHNQPLIAYGFLEALALNLITETEEVKEVWIQASAHAIKPFGDQYFLQYSKKLTHAKSGRLYQFKKDLHGSDPKKCQETEQFLSWVLLEPDLNPNTKSEILNAIWLRKFLKELKIFVKEEHPSYRNITNNYTDLNNHKERPQIYAYLLKAEGSEKELFFKQWVEASTRNNVQELLGLMKNNKVLGVQT